jgi:hypothetical protein
MGRSYWFECSKCGYRAKVSGKVDRGLNFFVQTIVCRDCKELYDAVTRVKVVAEGAGKPELRSLGSSKPWGSGRNPPTFQVALNRLTVMGGRHFKWIQYPLQCPVMSFHRVHPWTDPDKCPRCGIYLEKNTLPFRTWD